MYPECYKLTAEQLLDSPKIPLLVTSSPGETYYEYAVQMLTEIMENNAAGKKTVFICPCGPIEQYAIFSRLVNRFRVSLKDVWIINMDEYLTDDGEWIDDSDPFSFHGFMRDTLYSQIDPDLVMPVEQRIFPDPHDPDAIPRLIEELGGVDMVLGGIALNGHVAFNEPEPDMTVEEFAALPTRIQKLSPETRSKDAILGRGGAVDVIPKTAITVGMKEILAAKKIRVSMMLDMQRAVVRKACHGEVTASCPISLVQNHPDALLIVTKNVLEKPF